MTTEVIFTIGIATLIGLIIGFFISRAAFASKQGQQSALIEQQHVQIDQLHQQLSQTEAALTNANILTHRQTTELAVLNQQTETLMTDKARFQQQVKSEQERASQLLQQCSLSNEHLATVTAQHEAAVEKVAEYQHKIDQLEQNIESERSKTELVERQRNRLSEQLATLKTSLDEKEQHFKQQLAQLDEQKIILKKEFQNMANEILEAKGKAFSEQSKQSLDALLTPFKEQLEGFRKRVDEVHTHQTEGNATLKVELTKLHELNQRITDEAANLTKALKGDKKKQGNWGELQVEMILDQSGLRKGREYEREANLKDQDSKNWRPDFIVNLPEGKHVIIDSKVSLNAYNDYIAADTDEQRNRSLVKHVQAVSNHINDLYQRDYSQLQGINSPDFVFMFMPIEPAFIVAFENEPNLFNKAFEKHVVVVTPTTLLATLRTIANIWSIERQNQNARILADQGARVYNKLRVFVDKMEKLGGQLLSANKTYDEAFNTLTGSRSLTATVQKFTDLGVRVKKELSASVVEAAQLNDDAMNHLEHQSEIIKSVK